MVNKGLSTFPKLPQLKPGHYYLTKTNRIIRVLELHGSYTFITDIKAGPPHNVDTLSLRIGIKQDLGAEDSAVHKLYGK